ncbi:MAG: hypothetical protein ACKO96_44020 [Flammeovirgaceae bacterium]
MMKLEISLEQYLRLGGKLERVNWSDAYCVYGHHNEKIVSCEDKGEKNKHGTPLFYFTSEDGITHRYAITWIKIKVDFVLSETYR